MRPSPRADSLRGAGVAGLIAGALASACPCAPYDVGLGVLPGACRTDGECDDANACSEDRCRGGRCVQAPLDRDGDGYAPAWCGGGDCDDGDPAVHPGAREDAPGTPPCQDQLDNDCDGHVDAEEQACFPGACAAGGWCWESPRPTGQELRAVWAHSPDEAWVVGDGGTVLRWSQGAWIGLNPGLALDLRDVGGCAADEVWAVGEQGLALRWDGAALHRLDADTAATLHGVWCGGPDDTWIVGVSGTALHWDGTALRPADSGTARDLSAVWGASADAVWAVGDAGVVLFWDGVAWAPQRSSGDKLYTVFGLSAQDVLACGFGDQCLRWNGSAWRAIQSPSIYTYDLWGFAGGGYFAASGGQLLYWLEGDRWSYIPAWVTDELSCVGGSGVEDIWAAGQSGEIARSRPDVLGSFELGMFSVAMGVAESAPLFWGAAVSQRLAWVAGPDLLYRWDGEAWAHDRFERSGTIGGLWVFGADDVWVAGDAAAYHWDGAAWSSEVAGVARATAVWGSPSGELWVVGRQGAIAHRQRGGFWSRLDADTDVELRDVWGSGPADVWIAGDGGTLLRWQGSALDRVDPGTAEDLYALWGAAADDVWAAGGRGVVRRWNGRSWSAHESPTPNSIWDIWGAAANDVFAVEGSGVWHWDGSGWSDAPLFRSAGRLRGVFGLAGSDLWLVGTGNTIVHLARP